ncbi:MAG: hypothetical protein ACRD7E_11430, partial [Bryobacteraceae bacterium]
DFVNVQAQPDGIAWKETPVVVAANAYEQGNARTLKTRQIVENMTYAQGAHTVRFGTNLRFIQHNDERGSIAGENATQTVNFSPTVNAVDPVAFNLPTDINLQVDRPALESNINFLLGRVGRTARGFSSTGEGYTADLYRFEARYNEYDFYVHDTWKIRRNLTLDLGLRWELKRAPREANNLIRRPSQPMVFGAAPSTAVRWETGQIYDDDYNNPGPSIGFAWDPFSDGKTAIRSNYRIAYDRINTFVLSSAVFQNLPGITLAGENLGYGQTGGRLENVPTLTPPDINPESLAQPEAFSNRTITVVDPNFETPTTHMWSFGIQREIAPRTVVSADYIGRRAHNLIGAYNANQAEIFRNGFLDAFNTANAGGESALLDRITTGDTRRRSGESGAAFLRRQFASDLRLNSVAGVANSLATRIQGGQSVSGSNGEPFFFLPFPQFASTRVIDSNEFSTYHGLELQVERRFSAGFTGQFSYTLAKSLDTRSYDPTFTVYGTAASQSASSHPFDIANRKLNYARSDFDRRHVFQSYWLYELPFGNGKAIGGGVAPFLNRIIGGWQVAGFLRYQSGRPFTVFSGASTLGSVNQSPADCMGCGPADGGVFTDPSSGLAFHFDEAVRQSFSTPAAGTLGNTGRNFFQTAGNFNMDASLSKRTLIREGMNIEIRADITNLTNTPTWDVPTATITSNIFGRLRTPIANNSRKIQLAAKFNF